MAMSFVQISRLVLAKGTTRVEASHMTHMIGMKRGMIEMTEIGIWILLSLLLLCPSVSVGAAASLLQVVGSLDIVVAV